MSDSVKRRFQWLGFWTLLGMVVWPTIATVGPRLEGTFYPVVVRTQITRVEETADGLASDLWGRARKLRDCTFMGLEWYYTTSDGRSTLVPMDVRESSKVREPGWMSFGPWRVTLSREQVRENSYALVKHRCHPIWLTETHFWP